MIKGGVAPKGEGNEIKSDSMEVIRGQLVSVRSKVIVNDWSVDYAKGVARSYGFVNFPKKTNLVGNESVTEIWVAQSVPSPIAKIHPADPIVRYAGELNLSTQV